MTDNIVMMKQAQDIYLARPFRQFNAEVSRYAAQWFDNPFEKGEWEPTGQVFGSEARPFVVVEKSTGMRGVAKPGVGVLNNVPRQAHEKIASDLGFALGLPVPPVSLYPFTDPDGTTRWTSLSLWAFPQAHTYAEAHGQNVLDVEEQQRFNQIANACYVFDFFIDNADRHSGNMLAGSADDGRTEFAMIDHAFTMSYRGTWGDPQAPFAPVNKIYTSVEPATQKAMAEKIASLDPKLVEDVVARLKGTVLDDMLAGLLLANLTSRATLILGNIKAQLGEV